MAINEVNRTNWNPDDGGNVRFESTAATAGEQVYTDDCVLKGLVVTSTVAQWVQIHDVSAAPADTAVPLISIYVTANGMVSITFPIPLENGLYVCNSSTHATKTIGAADCMIYGTYKK